MDNFAKEKRKAVEKSILKMETCMLDSMRRGGFMEKEGIFGETKRNMLDILRRDIWKALESGFHQMVTTIKDNILKI